MSRPHPRDARGPRSRPRSAATRRPRSGSCSRRPARPTAAEAVGGAWLRPPCRGRSRPAVAGVAGSSRAIARQRELSLVVVMVVLGAFVYTQAPQLLSRVEPDPGHRPRLDHRRRRGRRGDRRHHPQRRPLGRGDDRPRRVRRRRPPGDADARRARPRSPPGSAAGPRARAWSTASSWRSCGCRRSSPRWARCRRTAG